MVQKGFDNGDDGVMPGLCLKPDKIPAAHWKSKSVFPSVPSVASKDSVGRRTQAAAEPYFASTSSLQFTLCRAGLLAIKRKKNVQGHLQHQAVERLELPKFKQSCAQSLGR